MTTISLLKAINSLCLQQRRTATAMSTDNFRRTLIQLIEDATEDEIVNLAIDVETRMLNTGE